MINASNAIFLSYASQDADAARRICDALRAAGVEVWFDQSELRGGDAWDASIRKQIKECALFVPMISAATNARSEGYFRLEWKLAVDRSHLMADDKTFFVPVILGDAEEPSARVPDAFRARQWSRLNDAQTIATFAAHVAKLIAGSASPTNITRDAAPVLEVGISALAKKATGGPSIAVLAFANRSASADDEYFSDGLADELLNVLAKIKGLRVVARTSSFAFKGKSDDVATIGAKLNVATLLEGSVRKSGNRVRISVELVKVSDGYHLWSESFDRTLDDVFAVQDEIAQAVVKELRNTLMGEPVSAGHGIAQEIEAATSARTQNPEAQRFCLQGKFFSRKRAPRDIEHALVLFEKALAIDPQYAEVHAEMGIAHQLMAHFNEAARTGLLIKARLASETALRLDPLLALPHLTLAYVAFHVNHDAAGWERELDIATKLAPNDAEVTRRNGLRFLSLGKFEQARAALERAQLIDPLSPIIHVNLGNVAEIAGCLDEAEVHLQRALEIDPSHWGVYAHLGRVAWGRGQHDRNVALEAKVAELIGNSDAARFMRDSFAADGWHGYLRAMLNKSSSFGSHYQRALRYVELGEIDNAFAMLDQSIDQHADAVRFLKVDPILTPLRTDPRFPALLRRAGLPTD